MRCDTRVVIDVAEKLTEGISPENRRKGGGRKHRIQMGSAKADVLVGSLRSGLGTKYAALLINDIGLSPGKKPIHKAVVARAAKAQFGMDVGKYIYTKTGSRDPKSDWAITRKALGKQWREDIAKEKSFVEGTLFVDEHSEFCMLGEGAHHGGSGRFEWRAPLKDGDYCHQDDGGELEPKKVRRKPKNPARADGIFGVCATTPIGGRKLEGRSMVPFRYRKKIIGMAAYDKALKVEFAKVAAMGEKALAAGTHSPWKVFAKAKNPYEA